jgi:predicted phage terminase large subunit-like protein
MNSEQQLVGAILRGDFALFVMKCFKEIFPTDTYYPNWHIEALCYALMQCKNGNTKRLNINAPPRCLKSFITSVVYPAYRLGLDPTRKIIVISYAQELSDSLTRQFRQIIGSDWYQQMFPEMVIGADNNRINEQITTKGGYRRTTSVMGGLTGFGSDEIIVDDPIKADDAHSDTIRESVNEWYKNTVPTRLNDPENGVIIIVTQRTHAYDLSGMVLDTGIWESLVIPAIATKEETYQFGPDPKDIYIREEGELIDPSRLSEATLQLARYDLGEQNFQAQFQQEPEPPRGNMIDADWLNYYADTEKTLVFDQTFICWDTASETGPNNDYSVATVWGVIGYDFYLRHVYRDKINYPTLCRKAYELANRYQADYILVEKSSSGTPLYQELNMELPGRVEGISHNKSKVERMSKQMVFLEKRQVFLPEDAPWLATFKAELLAFPSGRHDDQVDSMELFLHRMKSRPNRVRPYDESNERSDLVNPRREQRRRNIKRRPGTPLPWTRNRDDDDDPFEPSLVLGGV